ncbi:MAG: hypothetical protein RL326_162 [Pseudomonadota bacterium]|jgi:hypothetical protein
MNPTYSSRSDPVYNMSTSTRAVEPDVSEIEGILQRYRDLAGGSESEARNLSLMNLHFQLVGEMRSVPTSADDATRRLDAVESSTESLIYQQNDRASLRKSLVDHWKLSMSPMAIQNCVDNIKSILQAHDISVGDRIELASAIEHALPRGISWQDILIDVIGPLVSKRIPSPEERSGIFRVIGLEYAAAAEIFSLQ